MAVRELGRPMREMYSEGTVAQLTAILAPNSRSASWRFTVDQHTGDDLVSSDRRNFTVEVPLPHWVLGSNSSGDAEKAFISSRPIRCMRKPVARRKLSQDTAYRRPASDSGWKTELADQILDDDDEDELDCLSSFERGYRCGFGTHISSCFGSV